MTSEIFDGASVVITGGATGLGAAMASQAAAKGARVAILDVNEQAGRALASQIGAQFHVCDVSNPAQWRYIADTVGPVDYLHLNAGIMTMRQGLSLREASIDAVSYERYRAVVGTNMDGAFLGIQTMLPQMLLKGGRCITVTSSAAGLVPIPFDPIYAMTKHAVIGLVRSIALTLSGASVRLNAFCPGGIDTQLVPQELSANASGMMTPAQAAEEVASLLLTGANGEVRLKMSAAAPAEAISPPFFTLGAR